MPAFRFVRPSFLTSCLEGEKRLVDGDDFIAVSTGNDRAGYVHTQRGYVRTGWN